MSPALPSRRALLRGASGTAALLGTAVTSGDDGSWSADLPLISQTVALSAPGRRVLVRPDVDAVLPGTRIIRDAQDLAALQADETAVRIAALAAAQARGLDAELTDVLLGAALDLHVLSVGLAAPVASWAAHWCYVWPRDSAHVAVALARLGLHDRAARIVRELARLCRDGDGDDAGWFEARYLPGSTRTPDNRERQLDGTGWFLWALDEVASVTPGLALEPDVARAAARCARLLVELTRGGTSLPPASPDSWETAESHPTIGSCATVTAGLARAASVLDDASLADACAGAAASLRAVIRAHFGRSAYSRYPGVPGADAGMLVLLPPYARTVDADVARHLEAACTAMARPAGGIAPGALWRDDGVSWTPQTAMLAQARAVTGDVEGARMMLRWLGAHRTPAGSLPEKVLATGAPASVAPLAWTAALVVVAALHR